MAVSTIAVADSDVADKYLHTWQRTISGTAREDQYIQHGWSGDPTYTVSDTVAITGAADHMVQIMGDGTNYSRLARMEIYPTAATSAGLGSFQLLRLSSAGTGGTAASVTPYDSADTYAGAAKKNLTASKGTEGAILWTAGFSVTAATPTFAPPPIIWTPPPGAKPIIFGTATSDGIALKNISAISGGSVWVNLIFVVTSYL